MTVPDIRRAGFTLVELLIYIAIFGTISTLFVGILAVAVKVQQREIGAAEVNSQINFTLQTIQQLTRKASNIEFAATGDNPETHTTTEASYLKLRMADSSDPTCVSLVGTAVRLVSGDGGNGKCKDTTETDNLTNARVSVTELSFTKYSNPPGKDVVDVRIAMEYGASSGFFRVLQTSIQRAGAATFETDVTLQARLFEPANYDAGYPSGSMVTAILNNTCDNACIQHGLTCNRVYQIGAVAPPIYGLTPLTCGAIIQGELALCMCQ